MSGVANALVPESLLDTPLTYEAMQAIGSGLGAAGFIVFDDETDFAAVGHGVSKFLAVESCGQCTPCKQDGLALEGLLDRIRRSEGNDLDLLAVDDHLATVADSARCFLATQHQRVVGSIASEYADSLRAHAERKVEPAAEMLIAPIRDLADGRVWYDEIQADKQPDWTFDAVDSGKAPVDRLRTGEEGTVPAAVASISEERARPSSAEPVQVASSSESPEPAVEPAPPVQGVPVESLDPDDPEARLYTSEPLETDEGTIVIQQQNVGPDREEGGGEWPSPKTPPQRPAPGAD